MGTCASKTAGDKKPESPSAKVVDIDGRLHEFRLPTTAVEVLSDHPNCYLSNSDSLLINSNAIPLPDDHVLQFGQIYFLMPLSKSLTPLSLHDLCALAIKATAALHPFLHEYTSLG